jgi:hypothetical protein
MLMCLLAWTLLLLLFGAIAFAERPGGTPAVGVYNGFAGLAGYREPPASAHSAKMGAGNRQEAGHISQQPLPCAGAQASYPTRQDQTPVPRWATRSRAALRPWPTEALGESDKSTRAQRPAPSKGVVNSPCPTRRASAHDLPAETTIC